MNQLQLVFQQEEKGSNIVGTLPNHIVQNIEKLFPLSIQEGKTILIENGFNSLYAENFIKDLKTTQSIYTVMLLDTTEKMRLFLTMDSLLLNHQTSNGY